MKKNLIIILCITSFIYVSSIVQSRLVLWLGQVKLSNYDFVNILGLFINVMVLWIFCKFSFYIYDENKSIIRHIFVMNIGNIFIIVLPYIAWHVLDLSYNSVYYTDILRMQYMSSFKGISVFMLSIWGREIVDFRMRLGIPFNYELTLIFRAIYLMLLSALPIFVNNKKMWGK